MHTGKLTISRGSELGPVGALGPRLSLVSRMPEPSESEAQPEPTQISTDYQAVHDRLAAIERLARLYQQGVLTDSEFAAEKASILSRHPDVAVAALPLALDPVPGERPARGPSLLGRLLGWKIVPIGLAAGLAFSYANQPRETLDFFNEALRLVGV